MKDGKIEIVNMDPDEGTAISIRVVPCDDHERPAETAFSSPDFLAVLPDNLDYFSPRPFKLS